MSGASERVPASVAIDEYAVRCYCNHPQNSHPCRDKCGCTVFQPRPCICGHAHGGRCKECACRKFHEDQSPEFILRQGLHIGEWGIAALPRLEALMRPDQKDPLIRIWACLMVHGMDRRGKGRNSGRLVTLLLADGKTSLPMTPNDIVAELNRLDTVPRLDKHKVRSKLRELERMGLVRVVGKIRKHTRIFLYARPLKFRTLDPIPEPADPNLGSDSDPQIPLNPTNGDYFHRAVILPIRTAVVKTFSRNLRTEMKEAGIKAVDLGVESDPQTLIEAAVDELLLGVQSAYQKVRLGVHLAPQQPDAYKGTRARSSNNSKEEVQVGQSVSPEEPTDRPTDPPSQVHDFLIEVLGDLLPGERPGRTLCLQIATACGPMPIDELRPKIKRRAKAITSMGMVLPLAREVRERWDADAAKRRKEERDQQEQEQRRKERVLNAHREDWHKYTEEERGFLLETFPELADQAKGASGDD